jgi:hypothetical protein
MNQEIITIGRDGYFEDATVKYRPMLRSRWSRSKRNTLWWQSLQRTRANPGPDHRGEVSTLSTCIRLNDRRLTVAHRCYCNSSIIPWPNAVPICAKAQGLP